MCPPQSGQLPSPLNDAEVQRLLVSALAHEMSNPLSFVISNIEYLQDVLPPDAQSEAPLAADETGQVLQDLQVGAEQLRCRLREMRDLLQPRGEAPVTLAPFLHLCVVAARSHCGRPAVVEAEVPPRLEVHACRTQLARTVLDPLLQALAPGDGEPFDRIVHLRVSPHRPGKPLWLILEHNASAGPRPPHHGDMPADSESSSGSTERTLNALPNHGPAQPHRLLIELPVRTI